MSHQAYQPSLNDILPKSILDTDLYKFTMQNAVLANFPDVHAVYRFTNRNKDSTFFSRDCFDRFQMAISQFDQIKLTPTERDWLSKTCPYFPSEYIDYLENYRFKPEQVQADFVPVDGINGHIEITAAGPWAETILWEVPLMACLSEIYFTTTDTDWNYDKQEELAYQKGKALLDAGCVFSEFGTRRRRSFHTQDLVVKQLVKASQDVSTGKVTGTSNVYLAQKYGILPIGTVAHEWFMGIGALRGYESVNELALEMWETNYPNATLLALTDTFSTEAFFLSFSKNPARAKKWHGLRQDSGDPLVFAPRAKEIYEKMGIDHREKMIIYSDALNLDKALKLKKQADEIGFKASFGIGTFLSNDFAKVSDPHSKSPALNMVIKLAEVNGKVCVKISDDLTKNTGDKRVVDQVKHLFGLPL
ncbi:nicotinate phosphoribosyltransferase [Rhodocollybia butyracea]|uniref:Nicotinate phosphoribosyltransferase n=1 Tax=Rhodocollybia butyracea TaxID=206335 RepID=A0A9P5U6T7_9AGAR|nr:nicotinate phosphoribosyltransferase [Rhodocollybia butyracea]